MEITAISVTLGGTQIISQIVGRLWHRQEESAAHVCRLYYRPASGSTVDVDAMTGAALVVTVTYAGVSGAQAWFSGHVQSADWSQDDRAYLLTATDRLQEYFEALDEAAVDAAITGSQRRDEVQGPRVDGWRQAQDALRTVRAGYAIGRDGVHRLTAWTPGSVALTITAADHIEDGIRVLRRSLRGRINRIRYLLTLRAPALYEWLISGGFGAGETACQYWADQWVLPPIESVQSAVLSAGPVYRAEGQLSGGGSLGDPGISITRLPQAQDGGDTVTVDCGSGPVAYASRQDRARAASWTWRRRWVQTVTVEYLLVVEAPGSVAAWGAQIDERTASVSRDADYADWSDDSSGTRPTGDWDNVGDGATRWVTLDPDDEQAVIESCLAEAARDIYADHRTLVEVDCWPDRVYALDLHHTARLTGAGVTATGRVYAIEGSIDLDAGDAMTTITLAVSRCPGVAGSEDLTAPERPSLALTGATWDSDVTVPLRRGGRTGAAAYDETIDGVWTNYVTDLDPEAEIYEYRIHVIRPEPPAVATADLYGAGSALYYVYPPNAELVEVAP